MNLQDVKDAVCEALDRKAVSLAGTVSSLRVDVRFHDDGNIRQVSLAPLFEFTVRGRRAPLEDFSFGNGRQTNGLTSTCD